MTIAEWHSSLFQFIGLILTFITLAGSIVAIYFAYRNLKEMQKQLAEQQSQYFEQNRGNLIFYITKSGSSVLHSLVVKNFGNSPAKLLSIEIIPDLDWEKVGQADMKKFNISNLNNIFLAPQQNITSSFDFRSYPDKQFEVKLTYETCKKTFTEEYSINIDFMEKTLKTEPQIKDEVSALKNINRSIESLSDKFI